MDVIGLLATELNPIGKLIYNVLFTWVDGWGNASAVMGSFAITVILFTVFLKLATSPFDVWQKLITRKNSRKMEEMKPELEKIQKQCGNNKELLMQKQRALYKEHKYSTLGGCLPMLITLVIFIVVFSGFNSAVKYHNSVVYDEMYSVYHTAVNNTTAKLVEEGKVEYNADNYPVPVENKITLEEYRALQKQNAEQAVLDAYEPQSFLLTTNIFMPDTWSQPIPTADKFINTGLGKLGIAGTDGGDYEMVMAPLIKKYNYNENGKKHWNGYLILPILVVILNILSTKLNKPAEQPTPIGQTEEQKKAQQTQTKMLMYMMPLMMAVFAFMYSTAFTLYMFCNSLITTIFNLVFNIVAKRVDAKEKDRLMSITIKK